MPELIANGCDQAHARWLDLREIATAACIRRIHFAVDANSKSQGGRSCDGTITDMQRLMACLVCVTKFKADCVSAAQLPAIVMSYPAVCE